MIAMHPSEQAATLAAKKAMTSLRPHASIVLGVICGMFIVPVLLEELHRFQGDREAFWQQSTPVVSMTAEVVDRDESAVTLHITGTKHRECRYLGLQAFSISPARVYSDANIKRLDMPEVGDTKPAGATYDIGTWRVWPVDQQAIGVVVYANHNCSGHHIRSVIADVRL